jgi:hypothetical protein
MCHNVRAYLPTPFLNRQPRHVPLELRAIALRGCACIQLRPIAQTKPVFENHSNRVQQAPAGAPDAPPAARYRQSGAESLVRYRAVPRAAGSA